MKNRMKRYLSFIMAFAMVITGVIPAYATDAVDAVSADASASLADHVLIHQVYGGGGNSGATYKNDFIELYNPTDKTIDLTGFSVQYAGGTAKFSSGAAFYIELKGSIQPNEFYVIQGAAGTSSNGEQKPLPFSHIQNDKLALGAASGRVALVKSLDVTTGAGDSRVVDFVGYGTIAEAEGSLSTAAPSATNSVIRNKLGVDTNVNRNDFSVIPVKPSSVTPAVETKCAKPTADKPTNSVLDENSVVKFSTTTSGAAIEFKNNTDVLVWTSGSSVTIKADVTYDVRAVKEGLATSDVATFVYKVKDPNYVYNVKEALELPEGTLNVTVKGTIAYFAQSYANPVIYSEVDGKIYALYIFGSAPKGTLIGDEVKYKGKFESYGGMKQLNTKGVTNPFEFVGKGLTITPKEMTIADIKANGLKMIGQVVKIKNAKLGKFNAKEGTPINDKSGVAGADETINIYKAVAFPTQVLEGDIVDITAMIAVNNGNVQLYTGTKAANGYNVYDVANDTKAPVVTINENYATAKPGIDYTITVVTEDNKGVKDVKISYKIGAKEVKDVPMTYNLETGECKLVISGKDIPLSASNITFTISATDVTGLNTVTAAKAIEVDAKPQVSEYSPAKSSATGDVKNPLIAVKLFNEGTSPAISLTLKKDKTTVVENAKMTLGKEASKYEYQTKTLEDGLYTAIVTIKREDGVIATVSWNFTVGVAKFRAYYGQLHAHTAEYSDGSGTLVDGLNYLANLAESENVDFVSFTDHSNYFDTTDANNPPEAMNDRTKMTADSAKKWDAYVTAMRDFNKTHEGSQLAFPGYEMTWSGGPGHINTFNANGVVSRNNKALNDKNNNSGLQAYYNELIKNTDPLANLSQFNHPGATFGTFADFAYWSPSIDNKMVAVEVGNGEGAIGSGGYFPSYTEYTKALDKGWHVAPTNNQDNHKGKWGNANTGRTVIITNELTEKGLLTGLKNRSVYATEDKNLSIQYSVNEQMMGTSLTEVPTTPLKFSVVVDDPDSSDAISKLEVVTNSGRVAASKTFNSNTAEWNFELPSVQGYYYVRVTQADKNLAVTAPVWVGQAPRVGITSFVCSTKMPVTNEAVKLTTTLFNNESKPVNVKSLEYSVNGEVVKADIVNAPMPAVGSYSQTFDFVPNKAGNVKVEVTAVISVDGNDKSFTQELSLAVRDSEKLLYIGIDASHFNEYVNGNYKDSMGNFAKLASEYDVRVVELNTSKDLIDATKNEKFKMIILNPPTRRSDKDFLKGYLNYTDDEISAIKAFAESGKSVVISGWADYYEAYTKYADGTAFKLPANEQMSAQQNKLLAALGSTIRISDDEMIDEKNNGGQAPRLYLNQYNLSNSLLKGVKPDMQVYSNYGGASIYAIDNNNMPTDTLPASVNPIVFAHETSTSKDCDKDGTTIVSGAGITVPKYNNKHMVAASEKVTYANGNTADIVVAGAVFLSNFEVKAEADNWATPEYSNFTIAENLVQMVKPVEFSSIDKVHAAPEGETFTIQGIVTSNASGYDRETAFFDTVYVQDETAGIDVFPIAGNLRAGQTVKITGVTSSYNGERQLNVLRVKIVDDSIKPLPDPKHVTTAQASKAAYLGSLVKVTGKIIKLTYENGVIESIYVMDNGGGVARVFIDGYITKDKTIDNLQEGAHITAVGLSSIDTEGARIRVRDRADVTCTPAKPEKEDRPSNNTGTGSVTPSTPTPTQPVKPTVPVTDNKAADAAKEKAKATGKLTEAEKTVLKAALKEELKAQATSNKIEDRKLLKENVALLNKVLGSLEAKPELLANPEALSKAIAESIENLKKELATTGLSEKTARPVVTLESAAEKISLSLQAADLKVAKANGADFKVATADASVKVANADLNTDKAYKVAIEKDASLKGTAPKQMAAITEGVKLDTEFKTVQLAIPVDAAKAKTLGVFKLDEAKKTYVLVKSQMDATIGSLVVNDASNGQYVVAEVKTAFADTTKTWAKDTIAQVSARGIMVGLAEDKFAPEKTVTKAEFAAALLNVIGKADPNAKDWKASSVAAANQLGFGANFLSDKTADKAITREEMAYMMAKAYALKAEFELQASALNFKDAKNVNKALQGEVAKAQELGLVKGMADGNFKPASTGTRAEAAQMLLNLASNL